MRVLLHETITGDPVTELEFSAAAWSTGICRADTVDITTPGYTGRSLYPFMVPKKFTVTVVEDDGRVRAAGVLGIPEGNTDRDGIHRVKFPGKGPERLYEERYVLPYPYWPLINSAGFPIASRDTRITGVEYGTMMKRLYQQAMSHPGGAIPVAWEPDRPGTREKGWFAVDGKGVQEAVEDISQLMGGVEWDWVPQLDENDRLNWAFVTGTDDEPELTSSFWHTWQVGGEDPSIRGLGIKVSPEFMCQTAIFSGGKDDDRVMLARATGTDLIEAGVPLSEVWDSSHSSVSEQVTLDQWAAKRRAEGEAPVQYWSFDVREAHAKSLHKGDWCTIDVYQHWLIPDGSYPRRVLSVAGANDSDWLTVTVAGTVSW